MNARSDCKKQIIPAPKFDAGIICLVKVDVVFRDGV
jgi:hypothetical protein